MKETGRERGREEQKKTVEADSNLHLLVLGGAAYSLHHPETRYVSNTDSTTQPLANQCITPVNVL
jgi:hypothetical protein